MSSQPDPDLIMQRVLIDSTAMDAVLAQYNAAAEAVAQVNQAFSAAITAHSEQMRNALQAQSEALTTLAVLAQALAAQTTNTLAPPTAGLEH